MHLGAWRVAVRSVESQDMVRWLLRLAVVRIGLRLLPARLLPLLTAFEVVRLALRFRRRVREERELHRRPTNWS
jgi:hypothetical protein